MRFRHKRFICVAALVVAGLSLQAGATKPSVSWSNPHHAYVIFNDPNNRSYWSVKEISVDKTPGPTRVLGGPRTRFCQLNALAIGPQGNLYASGTFGPKCRYAIEIFAPGASGNVAPIATISGPKTDLVNPNGLAFDSAGQLYVAITNDTSIPGAINVYAAGATGNVAPVASIAGPNTTFGANAPPYVAVDDAGEIFVGQGEAQVLKFPAGAHGNVAPIAMNTVNSGNGYCELQSSGSSVYVAVGLLRQRNPAIYELSTADLSQTGVLTDHRFTIPCADSDSAGKVYVEDVIRTRAPGGRSRLFEYEPGSQQPYRVRDEGLTDTGGYIVVGP